MKKFRIPLLILVASVTALLGGQVNAKTVGATGNYTSTGTYQVSGSGTATFDSSGTMTVDASWYVDFFGENYATTTKVYTGSLNGSTWTSDGNFVITYEGCNEQFSGVFCLTMGDLPHTNSGTVTPFSLNICTGGPNWPETDTTPFNGPAPLGSKVTVTSDNSVAVVDADSDCIADTDDFYPTAPLGGRTDTDRDGMPDDCDDACILAGMGADDDDDGDGFIDTADNCPLIVNPVQEDTDTDTAGDQCDNCLLDANPDQADGDKDRIGDVCDPTVDPDTDGDGDPDNVDNCPANPNPNQADSDNDGTGNKCDDDYMPSGGC